MKKIILFLIVTFGLTAFFSYKLIEIPYGINGDEAWFGYNATLLSRNLRDENNRLLPAFVLSKGGVDYLQPVPVYFMAFVFKLFGPSLYNLRMTAVVTAVASVLLIYFLAKELMGVKGGIVAAIFMATTPIVMIQSHLAFDNMTPLPFIIGWLFALLKFTKTNNKYWLVISGALLGISYYSFKSMRIFVPVWTVLTLFYLAKDWTKKNFKIWITPVIIFGLSVLPFFAVIPWLEFQYAGAVLNKTDPAVTNIYNFVYNYLANFDPSFLFIKGDELLIHSTGTHGMYLLMSLPFFIIGLIYAWKKNTFWKLLILSLFLGPLLFGYIGQVHRANRLLPEIPAYVLICTTGLLGLWQKKSNLLTIVLIILFGLNYYNFINYYWNNFADDTKHLYICYDCKVGAYKKLKDLSSEFKKTPYIDHVESKGLDPVRNFVQAIYFKDKLPTWNGESKDFPVNSVVMTDNAKIDFVKTLGSFDRYYFYTK